MTTNRQWLLSARPDGMIGPQNFSYAETSVPEIGESDVLVKNLMFSFDPTQRNWMVDRPAICHLWPSVSRCGQVPYRKSWHPSTMTLASVMWCKRPAAGRTMPL